MKALSVAVLTVLLLTGVAPAPAAQPTAPVRPSFTIATFNVLGHSHTAPGGKAEHMAEGPERTRMVVRLLRQHKVDIVGFQEQQPVQAHAFKRYGGSTYTLYPGVNRPRWVYNSIAWRKDAWELVRTRSYDVPYRQRTRRMPVVLLRHRATRARVWVANHHNPADTRHFPNEQKWRDRTVTREIAVTRSLLKTGLPVLVVGDMNDRARFFCRYVAAVPQMHASNGGSVSRSDCRPPRRMGIDWIFGSARVGFRDHAKWYGPLVRRASDHAIVLSRATLK